MRLSQPPSANSHVKTQPIIQRFYSGDLKKRAFIIHRNNDRYKVIFQKYSDKIINLRGEIEGWQSLPKQPLTNSLVSAVDIAQNWAHSEDKP